MKKVFLVLFAVMGIALFLGCNNDFLSSADSSDKKAAKRDRSKKTAIDSAQYVDFTIKQHNARTARREDMLYTLNKGIYKNGNSYIEINALEGTIEIGSDNGCFNGRQGRQIYGVFAIEVQAASEDCLYIRRDQRRSGFLVVDGQYFKDEAIPDLAVCLPLYGYSRNRIEVSSVMDGFIIMPSGTYWKR